jgi:hypothetical protein
MSVLLPRLQLVVQQGQRSYHQASLLMLTASFDPLALPDTHNVNSTVTHCLSTDITSAKLAYRATAHMCVPNAMFFTLLQLLYVLLKQALHTSVAWRVLDLKGFFPILYPTCYMYAYAVACVCVYLMLSNSNKCSTKISSTH